MADRLTNSSIKELAKPEKGNKVYYDAELAGFGCRVTSAGAYVWIFNYRTRGGGVERRMTIGRAGQWRNGKWEAGVCDAKKARERAEALKQRVADGGDPMGDLHAERRAPSMNDLADRFEVEHLPKKAPATQDEYSRLLKSHIRPAVGTKKVADLRHADVEAMHRTIRKDAPYSANRAVAVLSKMLSLAIKWEMRATNPAIGIERAPEIKRDRYLSPAEIGKLSTALIQSHERQSANAVRLLLLTGARKGETLSAKWADFDLAAGVWKKPAATTKTKKLHRIPLSAPALTLLAEMKLEADTENDRRSRDKLPLIEFVFPSRDAKGKIIATKDLKSFWATICQKAELGQFIEKRDAAGKLVKDKAGKPVLVWESSARLHDLRHTYASILASSGLSLPIIGQLLGHTQPATTARYSHLLDDPLRAATDIVGALVAPQKQLADSHKAAPATPIVSGGR